MNNSIIESKSNWAFMDTFVMLLKSFKQSSNINVVIVRANSWSILYNKYWGVYGPS